MKGLLNLLTVLAALLNLTAGCGLRPTRISGQGILNLGASLARQQLNAGSTGGTLSAVSAVLGGNSGGALLTGLASLRRGGIGGGLETMSGSFGPSSATPGLAALGAGLGGGNTGSVLTGLGRLAAQRLQSSVSVSGLQSGSSTTGSGGNSALLLGQGILPSPQTTAGGFLVTTASSSSSATSMGVHTRGNPAGTSVDLAATQGGSNPGGVASIPGNRPTFIGPVTVPGGAAPGAGPGVSMPDALGGLPGGGSLGVLSSTSRLSASTVSVSGGLGGVPGTRPAVGRPNGGGVEGISESGLHGVGSSVLRLPGSSHPDSGPVIVPAQGLGPGTQQNDQPLGGTMRGTAGTLVSTAAMATQIHGTTARRFVGVSTSPTNGVSGPRIVPAQGQGPGTQQNSQPLEGTMTRTAGTLVSTEAMTAQIARTTAGRLVGVGRSRTNGISGIGAPIGVATPGSSAVSSGPGILLPQGPGQGTQQNQPALSGTIIGGGSADLPSTAVLGTQIVGQTAGRLLAVGSRHTAGISGVVAPNGEITPGPSAAGPGILPTQGVGPGTQPNSQLLGETIGTSTATLLSTAARGTEMAGSTAGRLLGVGSSFPNGAPMGGAGPSPSGGGSGIEIGQTLGQAAQQAQGFMRAGSSTQQSTTVTQTELAGGSPGSGFLAGVSPEQGSLPGTQPGSQAHGGVSHLTVSTSSQSTSSWRAHTHIVGGSRGNSGGAFPSIGGHGSGGVPIVTPGSGTTIVGAGAGSRLMHAIVGTTSGAHPPGGSGPVVPGGYGVIGSGGGSASVSSGMLSGVPQPGQKPHRRNPSAATAAGLALGTMAGAIAITAIGTAIGSALQNGRAGGGRRISGCSGGSGCHSGCGRRRRSVPLSKVPAEVLNEIPTNFERLY